MKIEHIALYVNDLEKAREFFVKYFDAKANALYHNPKTNFRSYFLRFESGARLEIMTKPELCDAEKQINRTGFIHLADALTQKLKDDGYEVLSGPRITGDGYYESCVRAFEENQIEITV